MVSLLRVDGLSKDFGGVRAVDNLSFALDSGIVHSIIGPNGAGKTTLFNMITGVYKPTAGCIYFEDQDITGRPPFALAARGLSRTFQNLQIFFNMTALENVMVGRHLHLNTRFLPALFRAPGIARGDADCREEAARLMSFVGLADHISADSDAMAYGALKRLEIARALASRPKLLLLDEPAAGLNRKESRAIDELILKVIEQGITVVLVEHDMRLVMDVSDHILVLDHGCRLAEGTAAEVRSNAEVAAAYLGGGAGTR